MLRTHLLILLVLGAPAAAFADDAETIEGLLDSCEMLIDFELRPDGSAIGADQPVGDAYADWGVSITLFNKLDMSDPQDPVTFDTSAPPAGREHLGAPNIDFGGPGWGIGGAADGAGPNSVPLGNALASNPDEISWFQVLFDEPVCVHGVAYLDVGGYGVGEDNVEEGAQMLMYDFPETSDESTYLYTCHAMPLGTNSLQWINSFGFCGIDALMIDSYEEAAWDALCISTDDGTGELIPREEQYEDDHAHDVDDDPAHWTADEADEIACGSSLAAGAGAGPAASLLLLAVARRRRR